MTPVLTVVFLSGFAAGVILMDLVYSRRPK